MLEKNNYKRKCEDIIKMIDNLKAKKDKRQRPVHRVSWIYGQVAEKFYLESATIQDIYLNKPHLKE